MNNNIYDHLEIKGIIGTILTFTTTAIGNSLSVQEYTPFVSAINLVLGTITGILTVIILLRKIKQDKENK